VSHETQIDAHALKARELPIIFDNLGPEPAQLLQSVVSDHLSPGHDSVNLDYLTAHTSKSPDPLCDPTQLDPGFHLAYFPTSTSENELLPDGTDILHAPHRSWQYRLWAGGRIDFHSTIPLLSQHMLNERITDVKVRGPRVFVRIERSIVSVSYSESQRLKQIPYSVHDYTNQNPLTLSRLTQYSSLHTLIQRPPSLVESRWLCFMRSKPEQLDRPIRRARAPAAMPKALLSLKMTPSPALLFRFSALSWNAHAIHLDRQYAREVYGLRERLVHGPLTAVLLLSAARKALLDSEGVKSRTERRKGSSIRQISSLEYKNHAPLYAGEPIVVTCGGIEERELSSGRMQRTMQLSISRETAGWEVEEEVCVTGTVELS
jgi:hydroxyacyl-ACP dehydratase HTD2-like protein with hotdog domain